jgi:hypothetical protein
MSQNLDFWIENKPSGNPHTAERSAAEFEQKHSLKLKNVSTLRCHRRDFDAAMPPTQF